VRRYVIGFMFTEDRSQVVLIQKTRPKWQAGRWNGPGGKIEGSEGTCEAMAREFMEETGVATEPGDWEHTLTLYNEKSECMFYRTFSDRALDAKTMEEEHVSVWDLEQLHNCPTIDNLRWIIPLLLDAGLHAGHHGGVIRIKNCREAVL
jgi:8-oxo-dGTP diphosphatase